MFWARPVSRQNKPAGQNQSDDAHQNW